MSRVRFIVQRSQSVKRIVTASKSRATALPFSFNSAAISAGRILSNKFSERSFSICKIAEDFLTKLKRLYKPPAKISASVLS